MFRELVQRSRLRAARRDSEVSDENSEGALTSSPRRSTSSRPPRPVSLVRRLSSAPIRTKGRAGLPQLLSFSRIRRHRENSGDSFVKSGEAGPTEGRRAKTGFNGANASVLKKEPGVLRPLLSVEELLRWRPSGSETRFVAKVKLGESVVGKYRRGGMGASKSRRRVSNLKKIQPPRLMAVHDFARGYPRAEAKVDGIVGKECPEDAELYRFNHWAYVDIFVYFSHYRVTIPPTGFIDAGHRHGVLVLGTLIFEWEEGFNDLSTILSSFRNRAKAANQLAAIAKFYGFDGWLVNVECELPNGSSGASDLSAFVSDITRATRRLVGPATEIVWYDSVTRGGKLEWQDELNEENEQFFKAAGAILTNYRWKRGAPVRSAVRAGSRRTDVFTGIDVFGRGTYGGGGFNTHLALRAIKQGGTSAALFAPAWTVESCPLGVTRMPEIEERFWTGPKGRFGRESVAQYFRERPVVTSLPFSTNFNPGWGQCWYQGGEIASNERWYNLSAQAIQPSFLRPVVAAGDRSAASLQLSHARAWSGSASVHIRFAFSASRMVSNSFSFLRLYIANLSFPVKSSSSYYKSQRQAVRLSYIYQTVEVDIANRFGLVLLFSNPPCAWALVSKNSPWHTAKMAENIRILKSYVPLKCISPIADSACCANSSWSRRTFILDPSVTSGQKLVEVLVLAGDPPSVPASAEPSPFITPGGPLFDSRYGPGFGSRLGSRRGSRAASRGSSRRGSRDNSPHSESDDEFDNRYGGGRNVEEIREPGTGRVNSGNFGEDFNDNISLRSPRPARRRDDDYSSAFAVGGTIDYSTMQYDTDRAEQVHSGLSSLAFSRFSSRLNTPGGSRFGSRFGSRAGSQAMSRSESRGGSPLRTPVSGETGALRRQISLSKVNFNEGALVRCRSGRSLTALKNSLMQAAGNMAGERVVGSRGVKVDELWLGLLEISEEENITKSDT